MSEAREHVFYKDGDQDCPKSVLDSNGDVVLWLCRVCCQGEAALADSCPGPVEPWPEANSKLVLVDFSNVAYACWFPAESAQKAGEAALAEHRSKCEVWAAFGATGNDVADCCPDLPKQYDAHEVLKTNLTQKLQTLQEHLGESPHKFVMCVDSRSSWRFSLFPQYKSGRGEHHDPRSEAEAWLRGAYPTMQWARSSGNEADDVLATLAKSNSAQRQVVVVTSDKDAWQLVGRPNISVFNPTAKKFVGPEDVADKFYGLEPQHVRVAKALWGDSSDALPNCVPRGQKQLVPLVKSAGGDLLLVLELAAGRVTGSCAENLKKNVDQIVVNWQLAGLKYDVEVEWF